MVVVEQEATAGCNRERAGLEINWFAVCAPLLCDSEEVPAPLWASVGVDWRGVGGCPGNTEVQWWDEMVRSLIHSWCQGESMRVVGLLELGQWPGSNMGLCAGGCGCDSKGFGVDETVCVC